MATAEQMLYLFLDEYVQDLLPLDHVGIICPLQGSPNSAPSLLVWGGHLTRALWTNERTSRAQCDSTDRSLGKQGEPPSPAWISAQIENILKRAKARSLFPI